MVEAERKPGEEHEHGKEERECGGFLEEVREGGEGAGEGGGRRRGRVGEGGEECRVCVDLEYASSRVRHLRKVIRRRAKGQRKVKVASAAL